MKLGALKKVVKNHGVLLLARFILTIGNINPVVYLALVNEFRKEEAKTVFGITSLFSIPLMPAFINSLFSAEGFEWMSLISTLIPVILGIILGNIE